MNIECKIKVSAERLEELKKLISSLNNPDFGNKVYKQYGFIRWDGKVYC